MCDAITGGRQASLSIIRVASLVAPLITLMLFSAWDVFAAPPLTGYNPARLPYTPNGPFIDLTAFAADTALPVLGIIDDSWRGKFTPKDHNTADASWNAASGVVVDGWRVAAFNRAETFINSNRDAIEFIYLTKKKKDLETGRIYQADISIDGYVASGVEVSYGRKLDRLAPGLSVGVTARYLEPHYLQDGTMTGHIIPQGPKSYNFNLFLDYAYSSNIVYNRTDEEPGGGFGYAADVGLSYRHGGWHAEALMRDIVGSIIWDSAPYTNAFAVTPSTTATTDGYQEFTPSIEGWEGHKRYHQKIPLKTDLSLGYSYASVSGKATMVLIRNRPRTWVEAGYRPSDDLRLSLGYCPNYSAIYYEVAANGLTLGVALEGFEIRDARAVAFQLSYLHAW